MKCKLLFLLLAIPPLLLAQQEFNIEISNPIEVEKIENAEFYISEVIDNRLQKDGIGIVQRTFSNIRFVANFSIDFEEEIFKFVSEILPFNISKIPLILRVNDLIISEESKAFSENGEAFVYVDLFKKVEKNTHSYLGSYSASLKNDNFALDVTNKHGLRISLALKNCLEQFKNDFSENKKANINITDLFSNEKSKASFIDLKIGFYNTYFEFVNSIPFSLEGFQIESNLDRDFTEKVFITDKNGKHCDYFAYYDGSNVYLNSKIYSNKEYFVKTHRVDNFLFFNERMTTNILYGKSGNTFDVKRDAYFFDMEQAWFYKVSKKSLKTLLRKKYSKLFRAYKIRGKKDIYTVVNCMQTLFKNEDPSIIKNVLRF